MNGPVAGTSRSTGSSWAHGPVACLALMASGNAWAGPADPIFADSTESTVVLVALVDYPTPLLTAAVEARVGGRVFATVADGAGAFELRVTPVDDAKPIVLLAKGNGTQSHIQYATILESMPTLMGQAGADGRLVYQENPYVKPSPFTTGLVVAIQAAQPALFAGNSPLAMPDRRVWSGRDQFRRTALLTALARGDVGLPAGAADSLDAVQDESLALSAWNAAQPMRNQPCPSAWCTILADVSSNPAVVPLFPAPTGTVIPYEPFEPTVQWAQRIRLDPSGGPSGSGEYAQGDTFGIQWVLQGMQYRLERPNQAPFLSVLYFVVPPGESGQVQQLTEQIAMTVRYARGPLGSTIVAQGAVVRVSYPTRPDLGMTTTEYAANAYRPANLAAEDNIGWTLPASGSQNWLVPACFGTCEVSGEFVVEPHRFDANGSGLALRLDRAFTWTAGPPSGSGLPSHVEISYVGGVQSRISLLADARGYRAATAQVTGGSLLRPQFGSGAIPYDPTIGFEVAELSGFFKTRINCDEPFSSLSTDLCSSSTGFSFNAGGTGVGIGLSGTFTWILTADGRLTITRSNGQRRYWQLIARVGANPTRYMILENVESSATPPPFAVTSRLVPYERS